VPRSAGKVKTDMRFKSYTLVTQAVEDGLGYGIGRLYKHEDGPFTEADIRERQDTLLSAIMGSLCEIIDFDPEHG
jgi:hypothetical protein